MGWKWCLNHHVSSLSFSSECKHGKLRQIYKTIFQWCTGEIFKSLTPGMFWFIFRPQLNLKRTTGTSSWKPIWTWGALAKYYRSDQSDLRAVLAHDKRWLLCFKAHIHMHIYIHLQAHFLSLQAGFCPSIFPGNHATGRQQVFISSRWAGAWRYAALFPVNMSCGSLAPWSNSGGGAGKLNDRGYN